jgi:hypothetical protein
MLDETLIPEELDIMVLTAWAIEGHLHLLTDAQREIMTHHLRGLLSYEASRPAERRVSNVLDFETAAIKVRLEKSIRSQRKLAIADARNVLQHGVNAFGDCIWPDDGA